MILENAPNTAYAIIKYYEIFKKKNEKQKSVSLNVDDQIPNEPMASS